MRCLNGLVLVVAMVAWFTGSALAGDPPGTPFLRLETGMHSARINRIDVDAGERYLVSGSDDKTARVWDLRSGRLLRVLRPPLGANEDGLIYAVALSPDRQTVAVGGWTGSEWDRTYSIYLFERASGRLIRRLTGLPNVMHHVRFSPDGRALAAALGGANGIRVYRTDTWVEIARDPDYRSSSYWAEFGRDGRLVTTSFDGDVRLYARAGETYRRIARQPAPGGRQPLAARFSPDGRQVAVGFNDSTAVNVLSGTDLAFQYSAPTAAMTNGDLSRVAWSHDGRFLYAGGRFQESGWSLVVRWDNAGRGAAQRWRAATNTIMDLHPLTQERLAFGAQDPVFGVLSGQGTRVLARRGLVLDFRRNDDKLRLSRDGRIVEFGYNTLDRQGARQPRLARFDLLERTLAVDVSARADLEAARTQGEPRENWYNTLTARVGGEPIELEANEMSRRLALSPTGRGFLLGSDWYLRYFEAPGLRPRWQVAIPGATWGVNLSADGRYAVAALADGTLRWYDASTGAERLALFIHGEDQRWVMWTPEGFYQASAGADTLIGYHLNQGAAREGEFIESAQLAEVFFRPELITARLEGREDAIKAAVGSLGDVRTVLAAGLPPQVELVSPPREEASGEYALQVQVIPRSGGVGAVRLFVNGAEVPAGRDGPAPLGGGLVTQRVTPAPGRSEVRVVVMRRDGKVGSEPVTAVITRGEATTAKPVLRILAVGISQYDDASFKDGVKFAARDAQEIARRLRAAGARAGTGVYRDVESSVLSTRAETGIARIEQALAALTGRARPEDVVVIFLAGHGKVNDGQYHFIPADFQYDNDQAFKRGKTLSGGRIEAVLKDLGAGKRVLILDTCHAGQVVPGREGATDQKDALARLMKSTGRHILAATPPQGISQEIDDLGHGVYTYALLEGLAGKADPNNTGRVELEDLAKYVKDRVPQLTSRRGYRQIPMRSSLDDSFWLPRAPSPDR